ncbi:hypothetical protein VB735_17310 [Halotia wernerae UHCC 0503]|nr:hypothetical protein [Halotia wernerae UHCC 0503]
MKTIKLRSQVGEDGILHLDIPVNIKGGELEITVTFESVKKDFLDEEDLAQLEWQNFIDKTYGCLADDSLIRYPQGEYEEREPIARFI